MTLTVNCPTCKAEVQWGEQSPHRPFCSDRCRLIDLGEWANESHVIPGQTDPNANIPDEFDLSDEQPFFKED
ncbi:DNA gyrase inhibitor YacG [Paraferrimonas sedimenticola]|uniref:DNA gyrase inhibitor YacG n=1 Tax=Paraferrimonas sedimenticola TaxID=375674 RepID=A0AA37RYS4_9GAMM|nr:DNA gyrase inhibitor YacG [Paraferrimonas sedimenticola]GLP97469.1 DNA gyrase inhibitor YacG [Paraferrimonas sedimenticola]